MKEAIHKRSCYIYMKCPEQATLPKAGGWGRNEVPGFFLGDETVF